ncbi:MAG: radical SAM protein [Myxococcota bacterium]
MTAPKLLFADPRGRVLEHPKLLATLRSGEALLGPIDAPIALPQGGRLVHLPGRLPVGIDPDTGALTLLEGVTAVGALLPPGYTRTYLPGEVKGEGPVLPQWAYTAAAWTKRGPVAWALRTDRRTHWNPERYSTRELQGYIDAHQARFPNNRVLVQLTTCALVYRCFTSQNVFYVRDEAALPASVACNARCVGCISEQPKGGPPASHERMEEGPLAEELGLIGVHHLQHASGRVMVSFGQGCEGEPLTRWRVIAAAIRFMRARTSRGSINLNTNGSLPGAMEPLFDAGLDAVRISLNSAVKDLYEAYYLPRGYGWEQVEATIALARKRHAYLALNLLTFPGVNDRAGEVDALAELIVRHRIDQVQTRSLCIDPAQYVEVARGRGGGGEPIGVRAMLQKLRRRAPWLVIGNFARARFERRGL